MADQLKFKDICFSVLHGEIIEDYLDDEPHPSCLILGKTSIGDPVHSVWAYNELNKWAVIVTAYRPNPEVWIDWKKRKNKP